MHFSKQLVIFPEVKVLKMSLMAFGDFRRIMLMSRQPAFRRTKGALMISVPDMCTWIV